MAVKKEGFNSVLLVTVIVIALLVVSIAPSLTGEAKLRFKKGYIPTIQKPSSPAPATLTPTTQAAPSTCANGIKDSTETDVDCGGSCPNKCVTGKICNTNNDCSSSSCSQQTVCITQGTCAAPNVTATPTPTPTPAATCTDGIKNQDETDIDCGGTKCANCVAGKKCNIHNDCALGTTCVSNTCTSTQLGLIMTTQQSCPQGYNYLGSFGDVFEAYAPKASNPKTVSDYNMLSAYPKTMRTRIELCMQQGIGLISYMGDTSFPCPQSTTPPSTLAGTMTTSTSGSTYSFEICTSSPKLTLLDVTFASGAPDFTKKCPSGTSIGVVTSGGDVNTGVGRRYIQLCA